ncbi:Chromatin modification-related protein EAF6 [Abortiporus biennis]
MSTEVAVPTAEDKARYEAAKKELQLALAKKRKADQVLSNIEVQIYNLEGNYLQETSLHSGGNILHGFEGYLKNQQGGRRKNEVHEQDRTFSNSSVTYKKSLELHNEGDESTATNDDQSRNSTPGLTTVIVPPARSQELTAAQQNKKNRDREYQRKKRAANRRSVGTPMSDDESVTSSSGRRPSKRPRPADDD